MTSAGPMTAPASLRPRSRPGADLRVIGAGILVVGWVVLALVSTLALRGHDWSPVVLPVSFLVQAALVFYLLLWIRERSTPVNIGGFFAAMIVIYALYPAAVFLANGLHYSTRNDIRFWIAQPTTTEIGALLNWYVIFFVSFAAAYLVSYGRGKEMRFDVRTAPRGIVWLIVAMAAAIEAIRFLTGAAFDLSSESYIDAYAVVARLPQAVRQLLVNALSMRMALLILLLCILFAQYRRNRIWIVMLILWIVVARVRAGGARSELFVLLLAAGILYHNFVRRIPMFVAIVSAVLLLGFSTFLGIRRSGEAVVSEVFGTSEFEGILANAYDLKYTKHASGVALGEPTLFFADFTSLVPQQLLPFEKTTKSLWYGNTYYPEATATGLGFAFGILAEAVTGFGWPELVVRGLLIGFLFGWLHRSMTRKPVSLWHLAFYVWLMVWSFHVIRTSSFSLLQWAEYHFLAPMLVIRWTYALLNQGRRRFSKQRPAVAA